uniref:Uncharacterized protein n=1 Tax=Leclercia adecarboxylata TaxID=83655 RepID=A0A7G5F674_9ENTR|nr:hypothetical protein [Leclercia adecarboxylata]
MAPGEGYQLRFFKSLKFTQDRQKGMLKNVQSQHSFLKKSPHGAGKF